MSRATPLMNFSSECEPAMAEIAAAVAVAVDVDDRVVLQIAGVLFDPFGRAEQPCFFAVPDAIDDRALRLPTLLQQFTESAGFFEQGAGAGDRIVRAVHPGVVMIAAHDPFVRVDRRRRFWR